jgi:hypothetical protein
MISIVLPMIFILSLFGFLIRPYFMSSPKIEYKINGNKLFIKGDCKITLSTNYHLIEDLSFIDYEIYTKLSQEQFGITNPELEQFTTLDLPKKFVQRKLYPYTVEFLITKNNGINVHCFETNFDGMIYISKKFETIKLK